MIRPEYFIEKLRENGIDCFAGVPDSLLKNICAYITDHCDAQHNIIAANEGAAVGIAAGHYLATGKPACVYMQNSGEGNIINPLASLTDPEVYDLSLLVKEGSHVSAFTSAKDRIGQVIVKGASYSHCKEKLDAVLSSIIIETEEAD